MNHNNKYTDKLVVALDIGTTKVCALAGTLNEHGKLEVLGLGKVKSTGVMRGVVANIDRTVEAIREAIGKVERTTGIQAKEVFIGIAGQHIKSFQHHGVLPRESAEQEISNEDIEELKKSMYKMGLPPGDKILHVIPQEYTLDNEQGIRDPRGMSGIRLEANFHIITGQVSAFRNLEKCVTKSDLEVKDMTLEPIASAKAVLTDDEMIAGVALVDIGGGTTDLTVFHEGMIRHTAVIPFGGDVITKDIKEGCTVMQDQAQKLKHAFGSALADELKDNRIIVIPGLKGRESREISEKNLSLIIQARVEEIMDYVYLEIKRSGYDQKLIGGIVLTGGGSLLKHIDKLASYHTGMEARIGHPVENLAQGFPKALESPIYSTAIGLLLKAAQSTQVKRTTQRLGALMTVGESQKASTNFAATSVEPESGNTSDDSDINAPGEDDIQPEPVDQYSNDKPGRFAKFFKGVIDFFEAKPDSSL